MNRIDTVLTRPSTRVLATNRVLRNTYALLSMTLLFSALTAGLSMTLELPYPGVVVTLVGYFGLLYLVNRFRNSAMGLVFLFALTGFMGATLGPRKDFSFLGGMLTAGILVAFLASLAAIFIPGLTGLSLAASAMFVILMAGLILYQTSEIIHGGETNYIMATLSLYVAIFNLFTSLLQLLGILGSDD